MAKAKFGSLLLLFQGILLILFVVFVEYGEDFNPATSKLQIQSRKNVASKLSVFQDLHVMVFLGFGLIITFLRRYSKGVLVHALLIGGLVIQWATLLQGFFSMNKGKIDLTFNRIFNADYAVIAVLISFGAILGKCNSLQMLVVGLFQTFFFAVNEAISIRFLKANDTGRSIVVHVFGAYFGIAVSRMLYSKQVCRSQAISMSNKSEMYSLIGSLFLWVYWPTMNSAFMDGAAQNRAVANTYYALAASCISTFSISVLQSKESKFNMLHLQNATIAGGVAIGSVAALLLQPWGAVIVGIVGALSSVLGYKYLLPSLRRCLKIHDTRGIHAAHGIPGIISGLASIIGAILANEKKYGVSLYDIYPARAPLADSKEYEELSMIQHFPPGENRKAYEQALYQLASLAVTIVFSIGSGLFTGFVIRINFFEPVKVNDAFDDHIDFEEENCIDVGSEPEFDDDHERHHDSVHGRTRLLDGSNHHVDVVISSQSPKGHHHVNNNKNKHGSHHSLNQSHASLHHSQGSLSKPGDLTMEEVPANITLDSADTSPLITSEKPPATQHRAESPVSSDFMKVDRGDTPEGDIAIELQPKGESLVEINAE